MAGIVAGLLAVCVWVVLQPRTPPPPAVPTSGLDPAVKKLIEQTLEDTRAARQSGAAWGRLGSVLMHYEFLEQSRAAFEQAERLSPQEPRWPYLHASLLDGADESAIASRLQRAVELCHDQPDAPRLRFAQFLAERGRSGEAQQHFLALLQLTPQHAPARLGLARLRHAEGRSTDGLDQLKTCLEDPHTAKSASALLATIYQTLGRTTEAESAARRSASLPADVPWPDPFSQEAAVYRVGQRAMLDDASALLDQRRFQEAFPILDQVTRSYPESDEAWYLMGWALNQQQRGAEAERALREHLRRSPQSPKGQSQLAIALLAQQRYAEAIEVLAAAVKTKPTWRELHSNLGYACVQLSRPDEAILHFQDALECDPNYAPTYSALGDLLVRQGKVNQARPLLRQALELNPADERVGALLRQIEKGR